MDVIVVGAGITGLVTTFLLKEKGVNVLLIEKTPERADNCVR